MNTGGTSPEAEPLLQLAPDAVVDDVVNLSRSASDAMSSQIRYVAEGTLSHHSNPVFAGSSAIGGADADFIIANTLFELKTTKTLYASAVRHALIQLLDFKLLDYDDKFELRRIGVYFARYAWVMTWPLLGINLSSRPSGAALGVRDQAHRQRG